MVERTKTDGWLWEKTQIQDIVMVLIWIEISPTNLVSIIKDHQTHNVHKLIEVHQVSLKTKHRLLETLIIDTTLRLLYLIVPMEICGWDQWHILDLIHLKKETQDTKNSSISTKNSLQLLPVKDLDTELQVKY